MKSLKKVLIHSSIKKIESFISSTFENLINQNENNFKKKIMKLKNNYPIDNIDKEIEISNLILSLEHFDKNKNIENVNDILNIKIKNIQNEVEKIILKILYDKNYLNEIENFWTNELFISNDDFGYELKENNCLAQKIREKKQIIKSKLKFKEGYIK